MKCVSSKVEGTEFFLSNTSCKKMQHALLLFTVKCKHHYTSTTQDNTGMKLFTFKTKANSHKVLPGSQSVSGCICIFINLR